MRSNIVKLQSSLTVQSKSVGQGVDFVFPPSQEQQLTTLTKIYQKEVYYRLEIWNLALTHKIKTRCSAIGQPSSPGWSPTIQRMVTHHPKSTP